jgi:hypothetical protein
MNEFLETWKGKERKKGGRQDGGSNSNKKRYECYLFFTSSKSHQCGA